jgi:imidazolonepropionase-like amidohydrolase
VIAALALAATLLIRDVTVIDPATRTVTTHRDVLLRDGKIASIRSAGVSPAGAAPSRRVIDGRGKFLLPGFADLHAHLFVHARDEKGDIRPRYDRPSIEQMLHTLLTFGVTTVRDPGAETEAAITLRAMVNGGKVVGPDIVTCGRIINQSDFDPEPFAPVHDAGDVRREIRWQAAAGVDCIKVYASMRPDLVKVAIDEAHAHHSRSSATCSAPPGPRRRRWGSTASNIRRGGRRAAADCSTA